MALETRTEISNEAARQLGEARQLRAGILTDTFHPELDRTVRAFTGSEEQVKYYRGLAEYLRGNVGKIIVAHTGQAKMWWNTTIHSFGAGVIDGPLKLRSSHRDHIERGVAPDDYLSAYATLSVPVRSNVSGSDKGVFHRQPMGEIVLGNFAIQVWRNETADPVNDLDARHTRILGFDEVCGSGPLAGQGAMQVFSAVEAQPARVYAVGDVPAMPQV